MSLSLSVKTPDDRTFPSSNLQSTSTLTSSSVTDIDSEQQVSGPHNWHQTSLLRLPDSIFLVIFQDLTKELYALSLLCRRLHHLALPVFLHQQGTFLLSGDITVYFRVKFGDTEGLDALSALRLALFVPSITRLTCHLAQLTKEMQFFQIIRLKKLIAKLSWIGEVNLHVTGMIYELEHFSEQRSQWMQSLSCLGNALIAKQCERLVVTDGGVPGDQRVFVPHQDVSLNQRAGGKSGLWNAVLRSLPFRGGKGQVPILENQSGRSFALQSLVVSPSVLQHLNFSRDPSYSTLQSLTITALWIKKDEWSEILPTIAFGAGLTLSQLSIRANHISPIDIFQLLSRLQCLTTLKLTFSLLDSTKRPLLYYPKVPHLTQLSVPPNYASLLSKSSASLRSLQSLDIYLPSIHYLASTAETISGALRRYNQFKAIKSTLTIPFDDPFKPDGAPFMFRNPFVAFRERLNTDLDTSLSWASEELPFTLPDSLIIIDFFLTDHAASVSIGNDLLTFIFPRWLMTWFPNLKHLAFSESKGAGDSSCNYSRRKLPFLHIIHMKCPNIRTVTFGNECIDMTTFAETTSSESSNGLQFLDLPDDVLLLIFSHASAMSIYTLSMVSQHIAFLAIPIYLSRSRIPDHHSIWDTYVGKGHDDRRHFRNLTVIRRMPPTTLLRLRVLRIEGVDVFMVFNYLQKLQLAIDNLCDLEEVKLNFCFLLTRHLVEEAFRKKWDKVLRSFVNAILQKTAASIEITGPGFSSGVFQSSKDMYIPDITELAPNYPRLV